MSRKDAGIFYEIRFRLRGRLSHHHWKLGRPFTPIQEDAWMLLNEVEQMVQILREAERRLGDEKSDYAYKIRHSLIMHSPDNQVGGGGSDAVRSDIRN